MTSNSLLALQSKSQSPSQSRSQPLVASPSQSSTQPQSISSQSQPPLKSRSLSQPNTPTEQSKGESTVAQRASARRTLSLQSFVNRIIGKNNGSTKQSKTKSPTMSTPPLAPDGQSTIHPSLIPGRQSAPKPAATTGTTAGAQNKTLPMTPPKPTDVVIAIMGATGSGKSTFINLASGSSLPVGLGLKSCTREVEAAQSFPLYGKDFILVDTPGFDDTIMSDADILKIIALYLETSYYQGHKLHGVIYMHRITDIRLGGIARRNFNMFLKLCGPESMKNVAIVTNMWNEITEERGAAREKELREDPDLFKPAIDMGAKMYRHYNAENSAQAILGAFLDNTPAPLLIQYELVVEEKDLMKTAAGIELDHQLDELVRKQQSELKDIESDIAAALEARDAESRRELAEERQRLIESINRVDMDRQRIAREYAEQRDAALIRVRAAEAVLAKEKAQREEMERQDTLAVALVTPRERVPSNASAKSGLRRSWNGMNGAARTSAAPATLSASTSTGTSDEAWRLDGMDVAVATADGSLALVRSSDQRVDSSTLSMTSSITAQSQNTTGKQSGGQPPSNRAQSTARLGKGGSPPPSGAGVEERIHVIQQSLDEIRTHQASAKEQKHILKEELRELERQSKKHILSRLRFGNSSSPKTATSPNSTSTQLPQS